MLNSTPTKPRTVTQVQALDSAIMKCDRLLDRAVTRGQLEASIRYESRLSELTSAMAAVSDNLWGKYCQSLLNKEEA
jgi:hypothetical protein